MFDLLAFWSTLTLITIPSWFVLFILITCGVGYILKKASRDRFDLVKIVEPFMVKREKFLAPLSLVGCIELAVLFLVWCFIGFTVNVVDLVINLAKVLTPIGGWFSIGAISGGVLFISAQACFDAYYKVKEIADKVKTLTDAGDSPDTE